MNRASVTAVAALALVAAATANATTTIYKITKIDAAAHTITLANGQVFYVDPSIMLDGFKVGDQVRVTYTTDGSGKNNVSALMKL